MYKEKTFGFFWILLGVCFLWDPIVGLVDCLPELVGWLLICIGVSALADMNEDIAEAQRAFRRMLWISLIRIAAELLVYVFLGNTTDQLNPYEMPIWTLLFAFSFAVLEIWFLLPAFRSFWRGVSTLSECGGARTALATPDKKGKSLCDRMQLRTAWFVVLHAMLTVLPECSALTVFQQENQYNTFWYSYHSLFQTVGAILSAIVGVMFLISWIRFFLACKRETAWLESLRLRYTREVLPDTGLLLHRRLRTGLSFFRVGVLLTVNLSLLFYEFLPDWGCVLVILCGCLMLGGLMQGGSMLIGVGLSVSVVGIPRTLLNVRYLKSFVPKDSLYLPEAYERYFPICVLASIEAVLTALMIACLLLCLLRMASKHTVQSDSVSQLLAERELRQEKRRAGVILLFAMLSAGAKIAEVFLQPRYGWVWLLQFGLSMIVFVLFCNFQSNLADRVLAAYPRQESRD